jgi:hypothetical protein
MNSYFESGIGLTDDSLSRRGSVIENGATKVKAAGAAAVRELIQSE